MTVTSITMTLEEAQTTASKMDALQKSNRDLLKALERQVNNMAFVVTRTALYSWGDKFKRELKEDRRVLKNAEKI